MTENTINYDVTFGVILSTVGGCAVVGKDKFDLMKGGRGGRDKIDH